jgi:ferredoxin-NADP reductase
MKYSAKVLGREAKAGQLMVLRLERPADFDYQAGQFCFVNAPDIGLSDEHGLRRPLSLASSPLEKDLLFTVRLSDSAFKRTLRDMADTSKVEIESAMGLFTLPADKGTPLCFLAGGMGISPFRSMLRYAADAGTGHKATLFYSSRVPEEALFLDEFYGIASKDPSIEVVATITRPEQSAQKWQGRTGRLAASTIKDACAYWKEAIYYLAGPPVMVDGMRTMLDEMGIDKALVKQEVWTGY